MLFSQSVIDFTHPTQNVSLQIQKMVPGNFTRLFSDTKKAFDLSVDDLNQPLCWRSWYKWYGVGLWPAARQHAGAACCPGTGSIR